MVQKQVVPEAGSASLGFYYYVAGRGFGIVAEVASYETTRMLSEEAEKLHLDPGPARPAAE
jgi:hypothetical protein